MLLIAPGGLRSTRAAWSRSPWDPRVALQPHHRVIAMDQRNAGDSWGPITESTDWDVYTRDQLALLDHLEIETCSVIGMCIGGPYALGLIRMAPHRIRSAVMLQPIGLDNNRETFHRLVEDWVPEVRNAHPEATDDTWAAFKANMFGGSFMFNATPEEVEQCTTPLLVLMGDDIYHPSSISRQVADLAPQAELIERWKTGDDLQRAHEAILSFLARTS